MMFIFRNSCRQIVSDKTKWITAYPGEGFILTGSLLFKDTYIAKLIDDYE